MIDVTYRSRLVILILLISTSTASSQELTPQKSRDAERSAKTFVADLESAGKCPVNIEPDPKRAVGLVMRPQPLPFFLFVPQMGLAKTDFQGKEIRKEYGVPIGYLFCFWTPVVDGKLLDPHRMQKAVYQDPKAGRIDFNCLVLTASRQKDESYVLHAFGTGEKPLFSVPLKKAGKAETAVVVKDLDVQGLRLKLELSFGDGRRASLSFGTPRGPGQ